MVGSAETATGDYSALTGISKSFGCVRGLDNVDFYLDQRKSTRSRATTAPASPL
jgi:hypothetical protein